MKVIEYRQNMQINEDNLIYYFRTNDCGVCEGMLEKAKNELKDYDINMYIVQIENNPKMRGKYLIFTGPTMLVLKDGAVIHKESGFIEMDRIKNALDIIKVNKNPE